MPKKSYLVKDPQMAHHPKLVQRQNVPRRWRKKQSGCSVYTRNSMRMVVGILELQSVGVVVLQSLACAFMKIPRCLTMSPRGFRTQQVPVFPLLDFFMSIYVQLMFVEESVFFLRLVFVAGVVGLSWEHVQRLRRTRENQATSSASKRVDRSAQGQESLGQRPAQAEAKYIT